MWGFYRTSNPVSATSELQEKKAVREESEGNDLDQKK